MITAPHPTETKSCHQYLQTQPLSEFRRRYRNRPERMHTCNSCRYQYERVRRRNLRRKGRDQTIARFATQLRHATDANRVLLLAREMLQRYGGVQGFAESWAQQARRAMEDRPSSTPALNFFLVSPTWSSTPKTLGRRPASLTTRVWKMSWQRS